MIDSDIIKKCYEVVVAQVFDAFYNDAFLAKPAPNQLQQAEVKFRNGILRAREARDKAISLLP
jgi:hypothetical protein